MSVLGRCWGSFWKLPLSSGCRSGHSWPSADSTAPRVYSARGPCAWPRAVHTEAFRSLPAWSAQPGLLSPPELQHCPPPAPAPPCLSLCHLLMGLFSFTLGCPVALLQAVSLPCQCLWAQVAHLESLRGKNHVRCTTQRQAGLSGRWDTPGERGHDGSPEPGWESTGVLWAGTAEPGQAQHRGTV